MQCVGLFLFTCPFALFLVTIDQNSRVHSIACTCMCNEFVSLCWLARQDGQRKSACLDGYRSTRIVLMLVGAMVETGRQFTSISTSERVGWMWTVSRNCRSVAPSVM